MKRFTGLFLLLFSITSVNCQYYLRGEIKDENGRALEGVKIKIKSKATLAYTSGNDGSFGIPVSNITDSITLTLYGYETQATLVDARSYQLLRLKMLPFTAQQYNRKPASFITNSKQGTYYSNSVPGESYSNIIENEFTEVKRFPETGFSLTVDKASYSNIRRFLNNEMFVPADAIRIEEMLNYFNFKNQEDSLLTGSFNCRTQLTSCPWNTSNKLLFVNIVAPKLNLDSIPASNLVFLIDVSGSMDKPNRLPLLQSSFKLLVDNLRDIDTISIVTYGGNVAIPLAPVAGSEKKKIIAAIDSLTANGDTPGENAIRVAYTLAKSKFIPKGNNRVILATDGDFNIGQTSEKELEDLISTYRQTGIYLTCLGVGMGNYKDSKLESLAKKGNGNFAYIDQIREAEKIMIREFTETMYAVANDAFVKVKFDNAIIQNYRLIGYDNKKNAVADSINQLEGGEVGSGHASMAVFEITPVLNDSLFINQPFATISLQYKKPETENNWQQHFFVSYAPILLDSASSRYRFAASVAALGAVLKRSKHIRHFGYHDVLQLAASSADNKDLMQNEFLSIIQKAILVYRPEKKE